MISVDVHQPDHSDIHGPSTITGNTNW